MITGELKSEVDRIRDTMWSGGVSNLQQVRTSFQDEIVGVRSESPIDPPAMTGAQYEKKVHDCPSRHADHLVDRNLSPAQMRFVERLTAQGVMAPDALYGAPFVDLHAGGPEGTFADRSRVVDAAVRCAEGAARAPDGQAGEHRTACFAKEKR